MKLDSVKLYYGIRSCPLTMIFDEDEAFREVPFAPVSGEALDAVCEVVARHSGCLSAQNVRDRITHNIAVNEEVFHSADGEQVLKIPASVQVLGNGFSVVWK